MEDLILLYDGLELKVKENPTAKDLQDLRDFGIDLMNTGSYSQTIVECFMDMKKMRKLITIVFEGEIPKTIKPLVTGPAVEEALRSFFGRYGLHFLS